MVALFVIGTVLPINMGALGYLAAWLVGMYSLGPEEKEILAGVSADLVLTLIGVTYLFAIARNNGTVDLIVRGVLRRRSGCADSLGDVRGHRAADGYRCGQPRGLRDIGPIALVFAGRYKISPLMMGMFVVHGPRAAGSPISITGVITNSVMQENDLPVGELTLFLASLVVNILIAVVLFVVLGVI